MADRRNTAMAFVALVGLASGCVERRFVIESAPPGARVYVNNKPVGFTPCDLPFTYYGTYKFQLEADGYKTVIENRRIAPPWYAFPPLDFISENVYPLKLSDIQRVNFEMSPLPRVNVDELKQQAEELRARAKTLPPPKYPLLPPVQRTVPPTDSPWPSAGPTPIPIQAPPQPAPGSNP